MIRLIVLAICLLALAESRPGSRHANDRMSDSLPFRKSIFVKDVSVGQCLAQCANEHNVTLAIVRREPFPDPASWPVCKIQDCIKKCDPDGVLYEYHFHDYICNDPDYASHVGCFKKHYPDVAKACPSEFKLCPINGAADIHKAACEQTRTRAICFKQKLEEPCPSSSKVVDRDTEFTLETMRFNGVKIQCAK